MLNTAKISSSTTTKIKQKVFSHRLQEYLCVEFLADNRYASMSHIVHYTCNNIGKICFDKKFHHRI